MREKIPFALFSLLLSAATLLAGCGSSDSNSSGSPDARASARVATSRSQLVGGTRALGEVGDFIMENDKIRLVIQGPGFSRGFGVYGGGILDADLRRPSELGSSGAASGNDQFAELFPALLVQAMAVDEVKVLNDGSDGGTARVEAAGYAGEFIELVAFLNRAVNGSNQSFLDPASPPKLRYATVYELEPDKQYVTIRFQVRNIADPPAPLTFPGAEALAVAPILGISLEGFTVPVADIALFGQTNKVFMPGVGFDQRFGLERAYARGIDFPAFPGFVTEFVASRAKGASYGLIVEESDFNYSFNKREIYGDGRTPITRSSVLVPFIASGFFALFYQDAPPEIGPGEQFEVVKHFIVGSGDVGSVLDVINEVRGGETGRLTGTVVDAITGAPSPGVSVVVYQRYPDNFRRVYSQYDAREGGNFVGTLTPGSYSLKVVGEGRPAGDFIDFEIIAGQTTSLRLDSTPPGRIFVRILDEGGNSIPAKASAVGRYGPEFAGQLTPRFLFDLEAGEDFRFTDMVEDDVNDPDTRQYVEAIALSKNGMAEMLVRPGEYEVVSSRGPEYDTASTTVQVASGQTATVAHVLRRVVDTTGWMALDPHVHSEQSIDSGVNLDTRVVALAAEGVEIPVATDHNYVTDYAPYVARNDLLRWLHPVVGIEMTTLESGHFNGYPLRYDVGGITHGAFEWARRSPDQVFDDIRALGSLEPDQTIVQVNHPRDDILGYFGQYNRDPLTAAEQPIEGFDAFVNPTGPAFRDAEGRTTFSWNFDAFEVANGKLYYEMHHFRVPDELPPGELPEEIPPAGTILRESEGDVAFPGAVDDWFNTLNLGYKFTAVGTGDSHSLSEEPGQFRTMIYVGVDAPQAVTDQMVVDALRNRRAVATNGPMLNFWVNEPDSGAMGQTTVDGDGTVTLTYTLSSAPWIGVGRLNFYRNGVIAHSREIDEARDLAAEPLVASIELPLARDNDGNPIDSWFVVEAIGYRSMHPVIRAAEIPPLYLSEALASLAGPLGFGGDDFGALIPPDVFPVTAYAITNPVWVTTDSGPFDAPGVVPLAIQNRPENDPKFQAGIFPVYTTTERELTVRNQTRVARVDIPGKAQVPLFYPMAGDWTDVRRVMARLGALGKHGH